MSSLRASRRHGEAYFVGLGFFLAIVLTACLDPCVMCALTGPGTFGLTGQLNQDRAFSSSAPLPDGNSVLVAGGGRIPGYVARAQIYDPLSSQNTFVGDAELVTPRANHTATLLQNGRVLIAGGDDGIEALNAAELYFPSKVGLGTFVATSKTVAPRTHHTATLLKDGRVLIAGGSPAVTTLNFTDVVPTGALDAAELYYPAQNAFVSARFPMIIGRTEHAATLLEDGTVLITGGVDENGVALASAEIFDPRTQAFLPTVGTLSIPRRDHTATLIRCGKNCDFDGDVLIAGGFDNATQTIALAELYDPMFL